MSIMIVGVGVLLAGCAKPTLTGPEISAAPEAVLPPRPVHYDIALPYPISDAVDSADWRPYLPMDSFIPLLLDIDTVGAVTDITPVREADTGLAAYYDKLLLPLAFEPGRKEDAVAPFRLPVRLHLVSRARRSEVEFPVDRQHRIGDARLYWSGLELTGFAPANIERFPSYFCLPEQLDSTRLEYVLAGLDIDTTGRPENITLLHGSYPDLTGQLLHAINWAGYAPARASGRAVPGYGLLAVFLYPQLFYPTKPIVPGQTVAPSVLHEHRVKFHPDRIGWLMPPIPKNAPVGKISVSSLPGTYRFRSSVTVRIDTLGQARLIRSDRREKRVREALRSVINRLRFYPALDFDGRPGEFEGVIFINFESSKSVRIELDWLPQPETSSSSTTP